MKLKPVNDISISEGQKLWARAVVSNPSCNSDSTTGENGLLLSRQSTQLYRVKKDTVVRDEQKQRVNKKILKNSVRPSLTTPFGRLLFPSIAAQVVEDMYENDSEKKLAEVREDLFELHGVVPQLVPILKYLEGIAIVISKTMESEYRRLEVAEKIMKSAVTDSTKIDHYWKARIESSVITIRYIMAKKYEKEEGVSPTRAAEFLRKHQGVLSSRSVLTDWINHAEYASVAEDREELEFAMNGINEAVDSRTKDDQQRNYVQSAVDVILSCRDGASFRDACLVTINSTGEAA